MAFYDYREPIEYVVDQYFERKRFYGANTSENSDISLQRGEAPDTNLPQIPCRIIRNEDGKATKFIYGDILLLEGEEECDPVIWQEELVRDEIGVVSQIITTFPDGESVTTELIRSEDNKVNEYKYEGSVK